MKVHLNASVHNLLRQNSKD